MRFFGSVAERGACYRAGQGDGDEERPAARAHFAQESHMRKVLLAGILAAAALAALPEQSHAWGWNNDPYSAHGFGWFRSMAFNKMSWIHHNGPLYSYGPYYGPGYVNMHIPLPMHGSYNPADPNLWNG